MSPGSWWRTTTPSPITTTSRGNCRRANGYLLIFLADCDGSGDDLMARIVGEAGGGLRRIFEHCLDFDDKS